MTACGGAGSSEVERRGFKLVMMGMFCVLLSATDLIDVGGSEEESQVSLCTVVVRSCGTLRMGSTIFDYLAKGAYIDDNLLIITDKYDPGMLAFVARRSKAWRDSWTVLHLPSHYSTVSGV